MTTDRITSADQFQHMTPEEIVAAEDAGAIDFEAIAAERQHRKELARQRSDAITRRIRSGMSPDAAIAGFDNLGGDAA